MMYSVTNARGQFVCEPKEDFALAKQIADEYRRVSLRDEAQYFSQATGRSTLPAQHFNVVSVETVYTTSTPDEAIKEHELTASEKSFFVATARVLASE